MLEIGWLIVIVLLDKFSKVKNLFFISLHILIFAVDVAFTQFKGYDSMYPPEQELGTLICNHNPSEQLQDESLLSRLC